ncbi:CLUMA_CG006908, isoform A [Clunio marinus]|uniref:CLUMA_CG006908, isoform A n=1 Tax=Clunio marinus TaxID=568069 RepID=A0A1J1I4R0_9DIPT|nr:CLUMA_CG006908, isoform A [Clunio marinus]
MRWDLSATLATVHFSDAVGIQWPTFVWIDDNTEETRVFTIDLIMKSQQFSSVIGFLKLLGVGLNET